MKHKPYLGRAMNGKPGIFKAGLLFLPMSENEYNRHINDKSLLAKTLNERNWYVKL